MLNEAQAQADDADEADQRPREGADRREAKARPNWPGPARQAEQTSSWPKPSWPARAAQAEQTVVLAEAESQQRSWPAAAKRSASCRSVCRKRPC